MTKRFITDEELTIATAMVSEAMLRALPEPEECTGQFTVQFEEKIEKLKKATLRKATWRKFARSAVAAVLVVLIGFSMLCAFNTEVRAAVVAWFKEAFGTYTTYWFTSEDQRVLPKYELAWIPNDCKLIHFDSSERMGIMVYQDSNTNGFTLNYTLADDKSQLTIYSFDGNHEFEVVAINGMHGELYLSDNTEDPHALLWYDEENGVILSITSNLNPNDIIHIANNINIAN